MPSKLVVFHVCGMKIDISLCYIKFTYLKMVSSNDGIMVYRIKHSNYLPRLGLIDYNLHLSWEHRTTHMAGSSPYIVVRTLMLLFCTSKLVSSRIILSKEREIQALKFVQVYINIRTYIPYLCHTLL